MNSTESFGIPELQPAESVSEKLNVVEPIDLNIEQHKTKSTPAEDIKKLYINESVPLLSSQELVEYYQNSHKTIGKLIADSDLEILHVDAAGQPLGKDAE